MEIGLIVWTISCSISQTQKCTMILCWLCAVRGSVPHKSDGAEVQQRDQPPRPARGANGRGAGRRTVQPRIFCRPVDSKVGTEGLGEGEVGGNKGWNRREGEICTLCWPTLCQSFLCQATLLQPTHKQFCLNVKERKSHIFVLTHYWNMPRGLTNAQWTVIGRAINLMSTGYKNKMYENQFLII